MSLMKDMRKKAAGLWSLIVGLRITGWNFVQPTQTTHYPRQVVTNLDTYRGHIDLVAKDGNPDEPRCIACMMCASVCPSGCISITASKGKAAGPETTPAAPPDMAVPMPRPSSPPKKGGSKKIESFALNYNTCSLCGLCVQNCPVSSLMFSRDVYIADHARSAFEYDLLQRMREREKVAHLVPAEGSGVGMVWKNPEEESQAEVSTGTMVAEGGESNGAVGSSELGKASA